MKSIDPFSKPVQQVLGAYAFFLAFPAVIIGSSISFYIFLVLTYLVLKEAGYLFRIRNSSDKILIAFVLIALLSTLFAPPMARGSSIFQDLQLWIQYCYWAALVLFVNTHGARIDWEFIFKNIFYGLVCLMVNFYFFDLSFSIGVISFFHEIPRNAFIFQLLCMVPFALFYVYKRFGLLGYIFCALISVGAAIFSQGRAGSILILVEVIILTIILRESLTPAFRFLLMVVGVSSTLLLSDPTLFPKERQAVASAIAPYNNRLATLIVGEDEGDLQSDQSWLIRKLMVKKAFEIYQQFPLFGIGINHFTKYDATLGALKSDKSFQNIRGEKLDFYNSRSAHNTYVQILAETGALGFVCFIIVFGIPVVRFLRNFILSTGHFDALSLTIVVICIHFYVISAITGAIGWFVLGLAYFFQQRETRILLSHPR